MAIGHAQFSLMGGLHDSSLGTSVLNAVPTILVKLAVKKNNSFERSGLGEAPARARSPQVAEHGDVRRLVSNVGWTWCFKHFSIAV